MLEIRLSVIICGICQNIALAVRESNVKYLNIKVQFTIKREVSKKRGYAFVG